MEIRPEIVWEDTQDGGYYLCADEQTMEYGIGETRDQAFAEYEQCLEWLIEYVNRVGPVGVAPWIWERGQAAKRYFEERK